MSTTSPRAETEPQDETGTRPVRLLKTMRWYDGFIVCLSASGFMLSTLGYSIGALGALGALALWAISATMGAVQTRIFTEPAAMFQDSTGGLAVYAREAWRRRLNVLSPISGFAYWIAYTSTLSVFGLLAADLMQAEWFPKSTWKLSLGFSVSLAQLIAVALIILVWTINVAGMRPTRVFGYVTGGIFVFLLAIFAFLPYLSGHFHASLLHWNLGQPGQQWGGLRLALVYLYLMGWSSYPSEQAATFAPEYHDTIKDTRRGLMSSAGFTFAVFLLVPLGLGGTQPDTVIGNNPVGFYVTSLHEMLGSAGSTLAVILILIACLLTMNASTMNASRALFATSEKGFTLKVFGRLNRHHVPANAMTLDMVVNIFVVIVINSVIGIVAASNMAYFVVIILALSGVAMLRADVPGQPRPIRLKSFWITVAVFLAVANAVLLCIGSVSFNLTGYGGLKEFFIGLGAIAMGFVLYVWRVYVQDRGKIRWRDTDDYVSPLAGLGPLVEPPDPVVEPPAPAAPVSG